MIRVIRKVSFGLRTQGLKYLYRAPFNEFQYPRLSATRALRRVLVSARDKLSPQAAAFSRWSDDALLFIYDLAVGPVTFDFISYLAAAELTRRRKRLAHIDVVFVTRQDGSLRKEMPDYDAEVDSTSRMWRLRNILLPSLALLPSVRSFAMCASREQAKKLAAGAESQIYPPDYRVELPCQPVKSRLHDMVRERNEVWPMLRASGAASRYVKSYLDKVAGHRLPLVISLRNYGFARQRNSRTADWIAFADRCEKSRFAPIFVPDTEASIAMEPADLGGHPVCLAACWNLDIRMALYEAAWLNMGVMHGPLELCWLNQDAHYLIFLPVGTDAVNSADALTEHGHRIGANLDFATPYQHIVWEPDELARIEAAFSSFSRTLPGRTRAGDAASAIQG
jgi:hypothetical protein